MVAAAAEQILKRGFKRRGRCARQPRAYGSKFHGSIVTIPRISKQTGCAFHPYRSPTVGPTIAVTSGNRQRRVSGLVSADRVTGGATHAADCNRLSSTSGTQFHIPFGEPRASSCLIKMQDEDVVELSLKRAVRPEIPRAAVRHGDVALDRDRRITRGPRSGRVLIFQPMRHNRRPPANRVVRVKRAVEVDGILAEQVADFRRVIGSPRFDVVVEPCCKIRDSFLVPRFDLAVIGFLFRRNSSPAALRNDQALHFAHKCL